ncbi:MAG: type III pantothenate kinase [Azoarcus sp.]|jgi:type III pantothenate kinase|nr:type III pantothenate kinase [Azoarcus sp.]
MMMLIDAGNSRIKWRLVAENGVLGAGACTHDATGELAARLETPGITRVLGCNVAGPARAEALAALAARRGLAVEWLASSAQRCGVQNMYTHPTRLGADRWAALIGARGHHAGNVLVVMAGTATTLDILSADGRFVGGHILPGVGLMRQLLADGTAQLPLMGGRYRTRPRDTADAIVSGCLNAQAGAIERVFRQLDDPRAACLLSGGAADEIEALLDIPFQRVENLVLDGLHRIARAA